MHCRVNWREGGGEMEGGCYKLLDPSIDNLVTKPSKLHAFTSTCTSN